jgi:hypothetical protein
MSGPSRAGRGAPRRGLFLNILTFDTMITGPVIHLLYWAGLGLIALIAFSVIGATAGIAVRESTAIGALISVPILVIGLLIVFGLVIAWRAACEFYVAIFRIAEDLRALRLGTEAEMGRPLDTGAPLQPAPAQQRFTPSAQPPQPPAA